MSRKRKEKGPFLQAYSQNFGNVAKACEAANIARWTFYEWQRKDEAFAQTIKEIDASFIDLAEGKLREKVLAGEWVPLKYYLETHARDRGYTGERQQVSVDGGLKLDITKSVIHGGAQDDAQHGN